MRRGLLLLNCGLGRDSITMLCLAVEGRLSVDGRLVSAGELDGVVFADTGAEWPHTYALLPRVEALCAALRVPFYHLAKPSPEDVAADQRAKGSRDAPAWVREGTIAQRAASGSYHRRRDIVGEYQAVGTIAVRARSNCTDNHKVQPMRRLRGDLCMERFGLDLAGWGRLVAKREAEPHTCLIGFAADELERAAPRPLPRYERLVFPLIEAGITKADEAPILQAHGFGDVIKSGCWMCPWQTRAWFWALSVQHPDLFARAVAYEDAALSRNPGLVVCGGGKLPLREAIAEWRARNPDAEVAVVLRKEYTRCASRAQLALFG